MIDSCSTPMQSTIRDEPQAQLDRALNWHAQVSMTTHVSWEEIQTRIWKCEICKGHPRVKINIRQQTPSPSKPLAFLLVGVAPPYQGCSSDRIVAKSATNDPGDNLRKFIEAFPANLTVEN